MSNLYRQRTGTLATDSYVSCSFSSDVDDCMFFVAESQVGDSCWARYRYAYSQQLFTVLDFDTFLCAVLFAYMQLMLQKCRHPPPSSRQDPFLHRDHAQCGGGGCVCVCM